MRRSDMARSFACSRRVETLMGDILPPFPAAGPATRPWAFRSGPSPDRSPWVGMPCARFFALTPALCTSSSSSSGDRQGGHHTVIARTTRTPLRGRGWLAPALGLAALVAGLAALGAPALGQAPKRGGVLISMIIEDPPG